MHNFPSPHVLTHPFSLDIVFLEEIRPNRLTKHMTHARNVPSKNLFSIYYAICKLELRTGDKGQTHQEDTLSMLNAKGSVP